MPTQEPKKYATKTKNTGIINPIRLRATLKCMILETRGNVEYGIASTCDEEELEFCMILHENEDHKNHRLHL